MKQLRIFQKQEEESIRAKIFCIILIIIGLIMLYCLAWRLFS
jgi:hypothetical protein